ncbi:MAG: hypothetical protein QNJ90_02090 [Planctomycetota bacterium]|nr:hypothetical protein [Planctomycetota bacterium]
MYALAQTEAPQAREILVHRYRKPREPADHERYLLSALFGEFFNGPDDVPALEALLARHPKDADAWLAANVFLTAHQAGQVEKAHAASLDRTRSALQRAAALEVLAHQADPAGLRLIDQVLAGLDRTKGHDLALLLESAGAVLYALRKDAASDAYQATAERMLQRLTAKDVADRTRLVVARRLARAFGVKRLTLDPTYWQRVVRVQKEIAEDAHTVARPRFAGIEASGKRVAYLIDMSDSMTETLRPGAMKGLEPGVDIPKKLDRSKIRNRFHLARELLRASLAGLDRDVEFIVIPFGTEARYLDATPRLMRATSGNVKKAMRELDKIEGAARLWDATNLHGALRKAFLATGRRPLKGGAHVHPKGFEDGVDTIFILSDGEPSWGDFGAWDLADVGTLKGDAEQDNAKPIAKRERINFWCPYRWGANLVRDLRRLNLFRKVEIHCLGTGEADEKLLAEIAEIGLGSVRILGK